MKKSGLLKAKVYFFLFLFVGFLLAPPLINLVKSDSDVVVASFVEEENTPDGKLSFEKFVTKEDFSIAFLEDVEERLAPNGYNHFSLTIYLDPVSPPPRNA